MKKVMLSVVSVGLLYASPLVLKDAAQAVAAEQVEQVKKTTKVPAMRNRVYTQLARAQTVGDAEGIAAGLLVLDAVKDRIDSLNSYERAMMWNFYGFMHYGDQNTAAALNSFEHVVKEQGIPQSLRISTLYSLAQLSMAQQDYALTLDYLARWQDVNNKAMTSSQHILFAQVYYQNKQFEQSLSAVSSAIELVQTDAKLAKENWLILQRANYFELKKPKKVTQVLEQLVRDYDKPEYWVQLAGMYGEIGEEAKQLAVMESAWQAGYIKKSQDIITLVQLYRYHNVPFKAASLLEQAIDQGSVVAEEKYFAMLAQAYVAAKDQQKAIPVYIKASEIAENGKYDEQLAQVYLNLELWSDAVVSAEKALQRGGVVRAGNMYLALGMAHFNQGEFDASLAAFVQAQKLPQSAKTAQQWHTYVQNEHQQELRLAMLN